VRSFQEAPLAHSFNQAVQNAAQAAAADPSSANTEKTDPSVHQDMK
jgi:hypothetical protein